MNDSKESQLDLGSLRVAYLLNARNLAVLAAWARDEDEISELFADEIDEFQDRPARLKKEIKKRARVLNDQDTFGVMSILFRQAFAPPEDCPLSLNQLAEAMDDPPYRYLSKKLRERILPMLTKLGFVEGFEPKPEMNKVAHRIRITQKGLIAHVRYLSRCRQITEAIEAELKISGTQFDEDEPDGHQEP